MNILAIALVAATSGVAAAQTPAPMTTQEKQEVVNAATKAGARGASGSGQAAAQGSAAAAAQKNAPKPLKTKEEARQAVDSATLQGAKDH